MIDLTRIASFVILAWSIWFLAFAGVGILFARLFGRRIRTVDEWLACFWIGWSITLCFLMFWHLLHPVDGHATLVVGVVGAIGLLQGGARLWRVWRQWGRREALLAALLLAAAFWAVDHSLPVPKSSDTGLYHLAAIRWTMSYPIVPGLGNLHGRLAFNQNYFLYVALLLGGPGSGDACRWATGLLLLPLLAQLLTRLTRHPRPGASPAARYFYALMLPPTFLFINNICYSSPSPDMAIFFLGTVLCLELLDLILRLAGTRPLPWHVARIVLLAATGITVKTSMLVMGLAAAAIAVTLGVRRMRAVRRGAPWRMAVLSAGMFFLILGTWSARGAVLSGWVLYPLPHFSLPVAWRIPAASVREEMDIVTDSARNPGKRQQWPVRGISWVSPWLFYMLDYESLYTLTPLALLAAGLIVSLIQNRRGIHGGLGAMWLFLAPPLASTVFCGYSAPYPRFAGCSLWVVAAGAMAFLLARAHPAGRRGAQLVVLLAIVGTGLSDHARWVWFRPDPETGFEPNPHPPLVQFVTRHELVIYCSQNGTYCWDAPLPNTPYPKSKRDLRLIRPGDLGSGFVFDPVPSDTEAVEKGEYQKRTIPAGAAQR